MLLRLASIWDHGNTRQSPRRNLGAKAQIVTGLNACHFFSSRKTNFTPEMDELRIKTLRDATSPEAVPPQVFANAYKDALQKDRKHTHNGYAIRSLTQQNISEHGMALTIMPDQMNSAPSQVGELIAYRFGLRTRERWHIGAVRWLRQSPDEGTELGVMHLAQTSVPVAVRAEQGAGSGTDYFRGLLVPKQVSLQQVRSIIVPASLYDVNSKLVMSMGRKFYRVRLTKMLQSTPMFAQFEFENID